MALPLQQSVNQLFQFGALGASMSPTLQERVKQREATKTAEQNVAKKLKVYEEFAKAGGGGPQLQSFEEAHAAAQKELFEISPSAETAKPVIERQQQEERQRLSQEAQKEYIYGPGDYEYEQAVEEEVKKRQHEAEVKERDEQFERDVQAILHPQEQVQQKMAQKGIEQVKQREKRRSFMKYLKENPQTSALGTAALKQIQGKLTKQEKTKMMNEYYGGKK